MVGAPLEHAVLTTVVNNPASLPTGLVLRSHALDGVEGAEAIFACTSKGLLVSSGGMECDTVYVRVTAPYILRSVSLDLP